MADKEKTKISDNSPAPMWLRLSMDVDAELAESVSEIFARYASGGVVIASTEIKDENEGGGTVSGPLRVSAFIELDHDIEEKRSWIERALSSMRLIQPIPQIAYENIHEENWMESWKQHFKALKIGNSFLVQPAWLEIPETERKIIRIDPGMAFGTGVHPTTQLSLLMLENSIRPGKSMLDIGCGSGILSIAGGLLGAQVIVGVDVDREAIKNAKMHAKLNESQATFSEGSVSDILTGNLGIDKADIVVANILASILIRLLNEGLAALVAEDGLLLLSGILLEQREDIESALNKENFQILKKEISGDWLGIIAYRKV